MTAAEVKDLIQYAGEVIAVIMIMAWVLFGKKS